MKKLDPFEEDVLSDYDKGTLKSVSPSKTKLAKFKAAATATFIKDRQINVRLSSPVCCNNTHQASCLKSRRA